MAGSRYAASIKFSQRGQALPLGIALIAFGALFALVLFNSGQQTTEKSRLANTADAAAYSGLVWQARALNFQAYTNRAMVANQVSIAQFISLSSWTTYGLVTADNIDTAIGWIPPVKPFTEGAKQVMQVIETTVSQITNVAVPVIDGVLTALPYMQEAMYYSAFAVTPLMVREVAKANDDQYSVDSLYSVAGLGQNLYDWQSFTKSYDESEGIERKADVITRSRDKFTTQRDWDIGKFYLLPITRIELRKQGTTRLLEKDGVYSWDAVDTLSLHWEYYRCSLRRGCRWKNNEAPIGYGRAYTEEDNCSSRGCGFLSNNRRAEKYATDDPLGRYDAVQYSGYSGVRAYYDLADLSAENKDPRLLLKVEVSVTNENIATASNIDGMGSSSSPDQDTMNNGIGAGMFHVEDHSANNEMASIATGEVYFKRPETLIIDGREKREYGSLFNPYWQVRLTNTSDEERMAAWLMRSPELLNGTSGAIRGAERYGNQQIEELEQLVQIIEYSEEEIASLPEYREQYVQAQSTLSAIDTQISSIESSIALAVASGEDVDSFVAEQQATLTQLTHQRVQTENTIESAISAIENAESLEEQYAGLQQQLANTEQQAETEAGQYASALVAQIEGGDSLVASYQAVSAADLESLETMGVSAIEGAASNAVTEMLEDQVGNAVSNILDHYTGGFANDVGVSFGVNSENGLTVDYTGDVSDVIGEDYEQMVNDAMSQFEDLEGVAEELGTQVEGVVTDASQLVEQTRADMNQAVSELRGELQAEVDRLEDIVETFTEETEQSVIDATMEELGLARSDLETLPNALQEEYQYQIGRLEATRDNLLTDVETTFESGEQIIEDAKEGVTDTVSMTDLTEVGTNQVDTVEGLVSDAGELINSIEQDIEALNQR